MADSQSTGGMRKGNTSEITIAPDLANIDATSSFGVLANTEDTSLRQVFPTDVIPDNELQAAIDYRNVFKQGDVITAFTKFYDLLVNTYAIQSDFSLENILYWYYKIKQSNKELASYESQSSFHQQNVFPLQDPANAQFTNTILNYAGSAPESKLFDCVSDSIGVTANSKYIQLDSTLPVFDVDQQYYGVPIPFSASLENKISANTRNVMYDLSQKTTTYMRRNLLNIAYTNPTAQQNLAADATTSHGLNLINDLPTFVNVNKALTNLTTALHSIFSDAKLFGFVQYLCNIGNSTAYNLRDIFPVAESDKDFVVVTSKERAQQSVATARQIQQDGLAAQALAAQQQTMNLSDRGSYNSQIGKRPYAPTDNITIQPTFAAPLEGSGTPMNTDGTVGTSLRLSDVEGTGNVTEKSVSVYGSVYTDLTTYLDTKPSERPADATAYWCQKYNISPETLAAAGAAYANPNNKGQYFSSSQYGFSFTAAGNNSPLTYANTAQGAYVGKNITAGFDVGVSTNYGYPPRTLLRITDSKTGQPFNPGGVNPDCIYRVGDTGQNALIQGQSRSGALDFYTGNDPKLASAYKNANSKGTSLRVEVVKSKV